MSVQTSVFINFQKSARIICFLINSTLILF